MNISCRRCFTVLNLKCLSLLTAKQSLVTSCPTKKLNFNECLSTTVSQKEKIIVEPAELASETFTIISNPLIVTDDHINSREFLREEVSRKFPQEKAVVTPSKNIDGQKAGENVSVSPQKPSQHLCDTIFATPKVHIPRKRRHDTKVLLDEPDTGTNKKIEPFFLFFYPFLSWLAGKTMHTSHSESQLSITKGVTL